MKNIMIIDGAMNCAYDVFAATDEEFALLFPAPDQDIAFIDEVVFDSEGVVERAVQNLWTRPVNKKTMIGLHGTIFWELGHKKKYYPNRRDRDLTDTLSRARGGA